MRDMMDPSTLGLPSEVRAIIFEHLLRNYIPAAHYALPQWFIGTRPSEINLTYSNFYLGGVGPSKISICPAIRPHGVTKHEMHPSTIRVCRRWYEEAGPLLYKINAFVVHHVEPFAKQFLPKIGPAMASHIRELTLKPVSSLLYAYSSNWVDYEIPLGYQQQRFISLLSDLLNTKQLPGLQVLRVEGKTFTQRHNAACVRGCMIFAVRIAARSTVLSNVIWSEKEHISPHTAIPYTQFSAVVCARICRSDFREPDQLLNIKIIKNLDEQTCRFGVGEKCMDVLRLDVRSKNLRNRLQEQN